MSDFVHVTVVGDHEDESYPAPVRASFRRVAILMVVDIGCNDDLPHDGAAIILGRAKPTYDDDGAIFYTQETYDDVMGMME